MSISKLKDKMPFLKYLRNIYLDQNLKKTISNRFHCTIDFHARIALDSLDNVRIGRGVYIGAYTIVRVADNLSGGNNRGFLEIGENTYIGELNNIRAGGGTIKIGRNCLISQQVSIIATNHGIGKGIPIADQCWDYEKKDVQIGDDVWIGCGAQILPGVRIGTGAVIGAGAVVNKNVPENAVVGGNPARVLKFRT